MCARARASVFVCARACVPMCLYLCRCAFLPVCAFVCAFVCVCVCVRGCARVCACLRVPTCVCLCALAGVHCMFAYTLYIVHCESCIVLCVLCACAPVCGCSCVRVRMRVDSLQISTRVVTIGVPIRPNGERSRAP